MHEKHRATKGESAARGEYAGAARRWRRIWVRSGFGRESARACGVRAETAAAFDWPHATFSPTFSWIFLCAAIFLQFEVCR